MYSRLWNCWSWVPRWCVSPLRRWNCMTRSAQGTHRDHSCWERTHRDHSFWEWTSCNSENTIQKLTVDVDYTFSEYVILISIVSLKNIHVRSTTTFFPSRSNIFMSSLLSLWSLWSLGLSLHSSSACWKRVSHHPAYLLDVLAADEQFVVRAYTHPKKSSHSASNCALLCFWLTWREHSFYRLWPRSSQQWLNRCSLAVDTSRRHLFKIRLVTQRWQTIQQVKGQHALLNIEVNELSRTNYTTRSVARMSHLPWNRTRVLPCFIKFNRWFLLAVREH